MIYIASPYTAWSLEAPLSRHNLRFEEALHVLSILTTRGYGAISSVVLGHTLDKHLKENGLPAPSYLWWLQWSQELLSGCDALFVLCSDGWETSQGVKKEIEWARENDLPITYIDLNGDRVEQPEEV